MDRVPVADASHHQTAVVPVAVKNVRRALVGRCNPRMPRISLHMRDRRATRPVVPQ